MLKLGGKEALKRKNVFAISYKPPLKEPACGGSGLAAPSPPAGLQHPDCTYGHLPPYTSHSSALLAV